MTFPKLVLKANYALKWQISLLNLQGKGDAHADLGENNSSTKLEFREVL